MLINKKFIEENISLGEQRNDFVREFSVRYQSSQIDEWSEFEPFTRNTFQKIYNKPLVDGVKLKFRYTTLTINARHNFY